MMSGLLIVLLSGCATPPTSNYCLIYSPQSFGEQATINYLLENDRELLRGIVTQNETYEEICG